MDKNEIMTNEYGEYCGDAKGESGHGGYCADVKTEVQPLTEQIPVRPTVIPGGPAVVKIPVVLAETNITIPVEATIKLDKEAMEIKRIKKNVYLTQCRIVPFSQDNRPGTGILYVSGFIRKNIEYATKSCSQYGGANVCGDIRHCTVQVPFSFTTRVTFIRQPIFVPNTTPRELEFFTDELKDCDVCADPVIGRNPCDRSSLFTEIYNEKPFCELIRADIAEVDIHKDPESCCKTPTEQSFKKITEKVIVNLTLKVLQKQQVRIGSLGQLSEGCNN